MSNAKSAPADEVGTVLGVGMFLQDPLYAMFSCVFWQLAWEK